MLLIYCFLFRRLTIKQGNAGMLWLSIISSTFFLFLILDSLDDRLTMEFYPLLISWFCSWNFDWNRGMVARGVPFDDGDRGTDDSDAAVRVQRIGMGIRVFLLDDYGGGDFLLLFPHVEGARSLRERRPPPHPIPGTRRRRVRYDLPLINSVSLCLFRRNLFSKVFSNYFWN